MTVAAPRQVALDGIEPLRWQTGHLGYRVRLLGAARTIAEARPENFQGLARALTSG